MIFCSIQNEDEIREEVVQVGDAADKSKHGPQKDDDEDGDEMVMPDFEAAESLNRGTDMTTEVIDATLKDVSPRYD